jgi:hypothetical protein
MLFFVPYCVFTLEGIGRNLRRLLAVEARTAHDRFGQTYVVMLRAPWMVSKRIAPNIRNWFVFIPSFHSDYENAQSIAAN